MFFHFFLAAQEHGPGGKDGKKETHGRRRFVSYEDQWTGSPKMAPPKNLGTNSQRHRAGGKVGAGKAIDIF